MKYFIIYFNLNVDDDDDDDNDDDDDDDHDHHHHHHHHHHVLPRTLVSNKMDHFVLHNLEFVTGMMNKTVKP